jgi:2',3'-cyclic-nucleotide 2'-phosphodiesterase (5'-nucleotidase family)
MIFQVLIFALAATLSQACVECGHSGQYANGVMTRMVRREQPEALNASDGPRAPLEWGQLNFLHTSDTHGWLEGHLKEPSYGADWGDFVSFADAMKRKARSIGVDLLIVDTGVQIQLRKSINTFELTVSRTFMMALGLVILRNQMGT